MTTNAPEKALRSAQQRFGQLRTSIAAGATAPDDAQREALLLEIKEKVEGKTLYTIGHSTMGFDEFFSLIHPLTDW